MIIRQQLHEDSSHFNIELTSTQADQFERYFEELQTWNQKFNLTRIIEPSEVVSKHFLDSLTLYPMLTKLPTSASLIDVGSGPGFPGIPLKIVMPDLRVTLLESTGKKCRFLDHVIETLNLEQIEVVKGRAEDAGQHTEYRQRYHVATARAVARLSTLAEYLLPFVKVGGSMLALKGQDPTPELNEARRAIGILGGKSPHIEQMTIPGLSAPRHVVRIVKRKQTPKRYPRRSGTPKKEPL
ncbi:16S rRNA (guanine(527)-N(7))-methyltransferase RsmG [Anaerolineales bacterium HSG6]|nr:16S rRNA (guanine(527)-N(7))-methyltransferase RsmG [Anaerolineales bacterium HSG6]